MQDLSSIRTQHRTSSASKLGPLLSECYSTASTNECGYTLHVRVTSAGPCSASKDHCHEQSGISCKTILKRGYYRLQVNVEPCQHLQAYLASFILELHCHPIVNGSLIITPPFQGGSISSTSAPFVRGGFISLTCSSFPRRVHIFGLSLFSEESPYLHHSFLQGKSVVSSLFLLARNVFSDYTKLVTKIFKLYSR